MRCWLGRNGLIQSDDSKHSAPTPWHSTTLFQRIISRNTLNDVNETEMSVLANNV